MARERVYVTEGWEPGEWRAPWRAERPADPAPPWLSEPLKTKKHWYKHPVGVAGITLAILILVGLDGSVFGREQTSSRQPAGDQLPLPRRLEGKGGDGAVRSPS